MRRHDSLANADDEPSPAGLAGLVRARRLAAGLTQQQLARAAGVSVGVVRDLEQGRTGQPRRRSAERIAAVLGVGLDPDGGAPSDPGAADGTAGRLAAANALAGPRGLSSEPGLRLRVLGSLAAWRDGSAVALGPARQRTVLGLLAVQPNSLVRREAICEALWEDDPPATAVSMIQSYVSRLRGLLDPARSAAGGAGLLAAAGSGYRLQVTGEELDVIAFEQLCARGGAAARSGEPDAACAFYEQALALWQGEPLADIEALRAHPAVADLTRRWAAAVEDYADAASGQGWHGRVLVPLRALAVREPMNERAHARLMIALAGSGQQAAALEVFDAIRRRLQDQLGIRPGAELAAAHARVLRQHIPAAADSAGPGDADEALVPARDGGADGGVAGLAATPDAAPDAPPRPDEPPRPDAPADAAELRRASRRSPVEVVPRQLPAAASYFVGRTCELRSLSSQLGAARDGGDGVAISVIGGTAGVGKTSLAVTWAHQVAGQFPDGQLYVNLRGYGPGTHPMTPADALRGFLEAFAIPGAQIPASVESLAGLYRSLLSGRRVLVVLDNARDAAQVRPLLPGEAGCAVVITSRSQLTGLVASDGAAPLTLDVLNEADARELLARRLGAARLAEEPDAATELTGVCARLPLALAITAARAAARPGERLSDLASELDDAVARLDALETGDPETSIRAVLSWSYESLVPEAARMFRLLALHPGPDIGAPAAASLAGIGPSEAAGLLRVLTRAALLTEHAPGRFAFHDLLRAYATELVRTTESSGDRRAAGHRILDHYLHTAHAAAALSQFKRDPLALKPPRAGAVPEQLADEESALAWFRAEDQILRAVIVQAVIDEFDTHAWQLTSTLAPFVQRSGRWHQHEWNALLTSALVAARRQGDVAGQARVHWDLGLVRTRLSRYVDALSHLTRALDLYRQLGSRPGQASCHLGLALMFEEQGHEAEALRHAERALDLYRAEGHRPGQAEALNAAGWYCTKLGEHQRALDFCQQALDLYRELGSWPGEAGTLDSIGYAHHQLGDYQRAIAHYQSALALLRKVGDFDDEALVLTHLGDAHYADGNAPGARDSWGQALTILEDNNDPGAGRVRERLRGLAAGGDTTDAGVSLSG